MIPIRLTSLLWHRRPAANTYILLFKHEPPCAFRRIYTAHTVAPPPRRQVRAVNAIPGTRTYVTSSLPSQAHPVYYVVLATTVKSVLSSRRGAIVFQPSTFPLTHLEPQSRFGDKPVKFQVVCPQNGTAVLKGLTRGRLTLPIPNNGFPKRSAREPTENTKYVPGTISAPLPLLVRENER